MGKYLLFCYDRQEPNGGMGDYERLFDKIEDVIQYYQKLYFGSCFMGDVLNIEELKWASISYLPQQNNTTNIDSILKWAICKTSV